MVSLIIDQDLHAVCSINVGVIVAIFVAATVCQYSRCSNYILLVLIHLTVPFFKYGAYKKIHQWDDLY
jgi:type III secretory pathway component EscS